jgi:hypothetical protein
MSRKLNAKSTNLAQQDSSVTRKTAPRVEEFVPKTELGERLWALSQEN